MCDNYGGFTFSVRPSWTHFFNWREVKNMADYKELYFELFNKVTDIIEELEKIQCDMEEKCIEEDNDKE